MNQEVFKKILFDYDEIGGGGLSLTPVVGEIFLDKDLVTRFKEIQKHPMITEVSFTTNVVRSNDLDDQDLRFILQNTSRIHLSIYGMDENEYQIMTLRNQYQPLINGVKRILSLVDDKNKIILGFRSLKQYKDSDYQQWIQENFQTEIPYTSTIRYANWGGALDSNRKLPMDATWSINVINKTQCLIPLVACQVFVDGEVSFCPCDDFNNDEELHLGSIHQKTLLELYNSERTRALWNFGEKVPEFCKKCSFYMPLDQISESEYMFETPVKFIGG